MLHALLIYSKEGGWDRMPASEQKKWMDAYEKFTKAMKKAGVLDTANRFNESATAKTVRIAGGEAKVAKGPLAKSKVQLGGYFVIDVPNMAAAIKWAKRCPGAKHGIIEVRPSMCR